MRLSEKLKQYRQYSEAEYEFINWDSLNHKGHGRIEEIGMPKTEWYSIWYTVGKGVTTTGKPAQRRFFKEVSVCFYFDEQGNYTGTHLHGRLTGADTADSVIKAIQQLVKMDWIILE